MAILLDQFCRRYGQMPSRVMGLEDEVLGFQFNMAVLMRGMREESDRYNRSRPAGQQRVGPTLLSPAALNALKGLSPREQ